MKLGVMIAEAVRPFSTQRVLGALDLWSARSTTPALFPLWVIRQDGNWSFDPLLAQAIRERGSEPLLYIESTGAPYARILAGEHDTELRYLGARISKLGPVVCRWDQEPNGTGLGADWQAPENKALYKSVFQHVSSILRDESDARMYYCVVGRDGDAVAEFKRYYPGHEATQVVGFTAFSRKENGRFPRAQFSDSVVALRRLAPDAPICVGETGRANGLGRRSAWLRELDTVPGVWGACVFDLVVQDNGDDWRWSAPMYKTFATL